MSALRHETLDDALSRGAGLEEVLDLVDDEIERAEERGDAEALARLAERLRECSQLGGAWAPLMIAAARATASAHRCGAPVAPRPAVERRPAAGAPEIAPVERDRRTTPRRLMSAAAPQAEAVGMSPAEWGDVYRRIALAWPEAIPWLQPGGAYYAVLGGLSHEQVVAALVAFDREDQRRPPAPAVLRARALAAGAQLAAARAAVAEPVGALMAARGLSTTQEQALERAHPGGGMGTAALVLGILGIAVPIICSLGAIIYGAAALRPAGEGQAERPRRGQAVAGLILGVMGFVTWVGIILIVALAQA